MEELGIVKPVQDLLVEPATDSSPRSDQEPAVGSGLRGPEAGWQRPPGTTADQHVDDHGELRLIRCLGIIVAGNGDVGLRRADS